LFQRMPARFPRSAQQFVAPRGYWFSFGHRNTKAGMVLEPPGRFKA
jgi:hypothetical protein